MPSGAARRGPPRARSAASSARFTPQSHGKRSSTSVTQTSTAHDGEPAPPIQPAVVPTCLKRGAAETWPIGARLGSRPSVVARASGGKRGQASLRGKHGCRSYDKNVEIRSEGHSGQSRPRFSFPR